MFSIMDFFPTFARLAGGKVPDDRPIDGVDQTDLLLGRSVPGRETPCSPSSAPISSRRAGSSSAPISSTWRRAAAVGRRTLVAGVGHQRRDDERLPQALQYRVGSARGAQLGEIYEWLIGPVLKIVGEYKAGLEKHPNPPAANMTRW